MSNRVKLDKKAFAELIALNQLAPWEAYKQLTGSDAKRESLERNCRRLLADPEVIKLQEEYIHAKCREGINSVINLTPLATKVYADILQDENAKPSLKKAVADNILKLNGEVMPKNVKHEHNLSVDESIDELVEALLSDGNTARLIEGEVISKSRTSEEAKD